MSELHGVTKPSPPSARTRISATKATRTVSGLGAEIAVATRMIQLGARAQVVKAEAPLLSAEMINKLYKEIHDKSPPKGMLPFSIEWYLPARANIHATLFYSIHQALTVNGRRYHGETPSRSIDLLMNAFTLYRETEFAQEDNQFALSFSRAWMLLRFIRARELEPCNCNVCGLGFITHVNRPAKSFRCAMCEPAPRTTGMLTGREQLCRKSVLMAPPPTTSPPSGRVL